MRTSEFGQRLQALSGTCVCRAKDTRAEPDKLVDYLPGRSHVTATLDALQSVAHLPGAVRRLLVVDPMRTTPRTAERIAASPVPVEVVGLDGQHLGLADASVDAVLMTWTLCSIADPGAAVGEIARVLRPGGRLHFVEHGRAPDDRVRHWQDRLNGIQRRIACGCNLNRDIPAILGAGGLRVDRLATFYVDGDPKLLGWTFQGTATRG